MFELGKHRAKRTLARVLLACLCVSQVVTFLNPLQVASAASAPNIINYQGRVLNANGIPVTDSSVSMIFELYTASSGGSCVWSNSSATCATATARSVTLTDGLFSEALGDTGSSYAAIGDTIFGDNAALYLQVTIGGETLTPRKQIVAAPYALNSDTLDGLDADTDGSTSSAIVALNSSGNAVFTGDPTGATAATGVVYVNPAGAAADETIFGLGDNGTERFRIDKEGDVYVKGIELDGVGTDNVTSGASLVGVYDEFDLSSGTTVQDVLDDLDATVNGIVTGGAVSKWTDGGTFTYLSATSDDLVIGDSTVAGASLFFDESAGQLDLGTDSTLAGTLRLYSATAATSDPTLSADTSGNLDITATTVELSGDLAVTGGDLTSTSATFNFLDAASNSTTVDIAGVTTDLGNTVNIATNSTTADTLTVGNSNASTTVAITGGDDWSITGTGVLTLSASAAATTAIVVTDTDYTNALSVGDNSIVGTTGTIDYTNFDVAATGNITVAAGVGLDTNGAGALAIGNTNATSVSICNSAACDTLSLGTNADADTITIGDSTDSVAITDAEWSITSAGLITTADDVAINGGDLTTSATTFNLLATNATTVNTFSAATTLNINDAAVTSTIDIGGVTASGTNTVNIATNSTAADTITVGNSNASTTVAITGGDDWSITGAGVLTMSASAAATTAIVVTDTDYTNALSVGDNSIVGTTGTIDYTNFDVAATGDITVAAGVGLDTNGAGALALGNTNATSVSICNSAACDTISLGTNADADTITIGDSSDSLALVDAQWSITTAGLITTADDLALNGGDLTSTSATFNFLDAASNSTTIDIGGVTTDLGNTVNIATNSTSADVITIGNSNASSTVAITGGNDWSISSAGAATFASLNTTDLTLSDDLAVSGDVDFTFATGGAGTENFVIDHTHATDASIAVVSINSTNTAAADTGTVSLLNIDNEDDGGATGTPDTLLGLRQLDTDEAVAAGLFFDVAAGGLTTAIDVSDAEITTALSIGANDITGTTGTINFTNFDVASTGIITVAPSAGIDTNAAGTLLVGSTNATGIGICNSAACDTLTLGTNTDADSITIGDGSADTVAIGGANWTIVGSGLFTTAGDIALNGGDLTSTSSTFNFLDASSNSTTIDIGGVTTNLGNTINIATNSTSADAIAIGNDNSSTTVAITGGDDWSITGAGVLTMSAGSTATTAIVATSGNYTNALSIADNNITGTTYSLIGTTSTINFTNFDVAATGDITVAAGTGLDTNAAGALAIGNTNATSVSNCNSAACDTWTVGTNTDADTITIGESNDDVSITDAQWSISSAGAASFTSIAFTDDVDMTFVTDGAGSENMSINVTHATDVSLTPLALTFTDTAAADTGTNYLVGLLNADDAGATGTPDGFIVLQSTDTDEAVADGIVFDVAAGGLTTAVNASDAQIGTALSVGANEILGTTGTINFDNFDVSSAGEILVAATQGLDTNAAGALRLGQSNATSVAVCNAANCDTVSIGIGGDADSILIGDTSDNLAIIEADWSISAAGLITTADDVAINGGDLTTSATTFNLLATNATTVNTFSAATTLNINDAAVTSTIDIGGVTASGTNTVNIATNSTAADTITVGNSNASTTVAITGGDDWSITGTGVLTLSASAAATTAIVVTDTDYTNALSVGDNSIVGTTGTIDYTNFDVSAGGNITVAAGVGLDTNGAGALALGNTNATSVSICNSAACDTISLGTNADADTITIGDLTDNVSIADAQWSISAAGTGTFADIVCTDCLDFDSFSDTLALDSSTSIAVDGAETFSIDSASTGDVLVTLASTGDFEVWSSGTSMFSIQDPGFVRIGSGTGTNSNEGLVIDIADVTGATDSYRAFAGGSTSIGLADGATVASQHMFQFFAASLSGVAGGGTETITTASTVHIAGAPSNGGDLTITNGPYALFVDGDTSRFDGDAIIGGSTATTETLSDAGFSLGGDDLFVAGTTGVEGVIYTDGGLAVGAAGDITCTDCLTYTDFTDSNSLDSAYTVAHGSVNFTHNLDSTGDWVVQDGGSPFFTINDDTTIDYTTAATGTDAFDFDLSTLTAGTGIDLDVNSLTTGTALSLGSTSASVSSGDLLNANHTATYTANTTLSGSVVDLTRALTMNGTGNTLSVTGSLVSLTNTMTQTAGTLTDTSVVLDINQNYATSSGNAVDILQAGTGAALKILQTGDTGGTLDASVGGSVHISDTANDDYSFTIYNNTGASSNTAMARIFNDHIGHDTNILEIVNDSNTLTSSGLVITQNVVADATTAATSQGLAILVNEAASSDEVILVVSDADGTPDAEFRLENDGDLFADGAAYNSGADYAEFFYTLDPTLGDHQVVCQDLNNNLAVKKCGLGDPTVVGVVSTNPGFVGNNIPGAEGSLEGNPNYRIVGLEGQIETYVTAADGAVAVGDPLTASAITAGYAGKASSAGRIIGFAMEPLASGNGLIKVRVSPGWHAGDLLADDGSVQSFAATLALESLSTATASTPASGSNVLAFRGSAWNGNAAETLTMSLSNKVTDVNNYRLSVSNNTGAEVAYINNLGDLVLSGKLYPSNQGVAQTSAYIYYDSNGVGYMRTNAAGWGTGSYDFAEMFPSPEILTPGEVVVFGDGAEQVKRSTGQTYDDRIAGVVSTRPGFLAGTYKPGDSPIALSGRVPTKVNTENGSIAIGDPLTTSSTPGVAMKATEPGPIVGYAMQPLSSGSGMITVFIRASYYDGDGTEAPAIVSSPVSEVGTAGNLSSLSLNGGSITSVASITGLGNTWRLTEMGDLITRGRLVQVVKSHQNEDVETYAAATREMTIQLSGTATLSNNSAIVKFEDVDPQFNDIIATTAPYRVLATPSGVTGQIYVTDRTSSGFTIHAESSADGVLVDWLVIAYHKDYEPELESSDAVTEDVTPDPEPVVESTEPEPESEPTSETTSPTDEQPADEVVGEEEVVEAPTDESVVEETVSTDLEEVPATTDPATEDTGATPGPVAEAPLVEEPVTNEVLVEEPVATEPVATP